MNKSIFADVCVGASDYVNGDCDGENDGENDVAEIAPEDGCQVTCTDPFNEEWTYTLRATGTSTVIDDGNDNVEIYLKAEYLDPYGNVIPLREDKWSDNKEISRGMLVSFSSFYDEENSHLRNLEAPQGIEGDRLDYPINAFSYAPYYLWILFYSSRLLFSVSDKVSATYSHKLDYSACDDTYLEVLVCADAATKAGRRFCYYSENTALVDCYPHQNGETIHIRSIDSEGTYEG